MNSTEITAFLVQLRIYCENYGHISKREIAEALIVLSDVFKQELEKNDTERRGMIERYITEKYNELFRPFVFTAKHYYTILISVGVVVVLMLILIHLLKIDQVIASIEYIMT